MENLKRYENFLKESFSGMEDEEFLQDLKEEGLKYLYEDFKKIELRVDDIIFDIQDINKEIGEFIKEIDQENDISDDSKNYLISRLEELEDRLNSPNF
jgi:hypothetical protein